jgi:hypothetical protein
MADREPRLHLGWIIFVPIEIVVGIERVAGHPQVEDLVRVEVRRQVLSENKHIPFPGIGMPRAKRQRSRAQYTEFTS